MEAHPIPEMDPLWTVSSLEWIWSIPQWFTVVGLSGGLAIQGTQVKATKTRHFFYIFYIVLHVFTSWTSFSHIFTIFHMLYFSPIFQVGAGDSQPCCWKSVSYWRLWAYGISKSIAVISWQHLGRLGRVGFPWLLNLYVCSSGMCVAMFEI